MLTITNLFSPVRSGMVAVRNVAGPSRPLFPAYLTAGYW